MKAMNDPQISRDDAQIIARWVHQIRPTWDLPGILAALSKRGDAQPARLALAALAAAATASNRSPAVIAMDGNHWRIGHAIESEADRHPSNEDVRTLCVECYKPQRVHPWIGCPGYVAKPQPAENMYDLLDAARVEAARGGQARTDAEHATAAAKAGDPTLEGTPA